jgi:hypothetical protein
MALALHAPYQGLAESDGCTARQTHRSDWFGTDSWEHMTRLATEGWPEGCQQMAEIVQKIDLATAGAVMVPQPVWDVTGDFVDVEAFIKGEPENMVRWEELETQKRVARIAFNISVSGAVSTEAIRWKGATVLALIDRLEAQGIRVELDLANPVKNWEKPISTHCLWYNVKKADQPLHLDRLAFHLVNPSALRRLGFSAESAQPAEIVNRMGFYTGGCYGLPIALKADQTKGYDLVIPEFHLDSVAEAVKQIEEMFETVCQAGSLTIG